MAGASPVDADQQPGPEAGRDLPDRRRQDREVVGEGVRPGVARPQQHRQRLGDIGQPGPEREEAVTHLERGSRPFPRPHRSPSACGPTVYRPLRRALLPEKSRECGYRAISQNGALFTRGPVPRQRPPRAIPAARASRVTHPPRTRGDTPTPAPASQPTQNRSGATGPLVPHRMIAGSRQGAFSPPPGWSLSAAGEQPGTAVVPPAAC